MFAPRVHAVALAIFIAGARAGAGESDPSPSQVQAAPQSFTDSAAPLGLRTQGTLRELFLDVTGADARAVTRPEFEMRYTVSNVWNEPMQLARHGDSAVQGLDEQADALGLKLRLPWSAVFGAGPGDALPGSPRPLFQRLSTALEVKATEHWGGWSDPAIEAWHSLIGSFNFNRHQHPRNRIRLQYADSGGTAFNFDRPRFAFGDVVLRTQLLLVEDAASRAGLSARFDLKLPTGSLSSAGGSGGTDAGIALLGTARVSDAITLHGFVAFAHFSPLDAPVLLQVKPWHFSAEGSAIFAAGPVQLLLEDRISSALLQPGWNRLEAGGDNGLLSSGYFASFRPHNQISWALRFDGFALWLSEDFTPGSNPRSKITVYYESNSPDVTLGASWTHSI